MDQPTAHQKSLFFKTIASQPEKMSSGSTPQKSLADKRVSEALFDKNKVYSQRLAKLHLQTKHDNHQMTTVGSPQNLNYSNRLKVNSVHQQVSPVTNGIAIESTCLNNGIQSTFEIQNNH